jgi:hypothetical protein
VHVTTGTTTDLSISVGGGRPVGVDLKVGLRFSTLEELEAIQTASRRPVIVAVPFLPPKRRSEARKRGLSWIEYDNGLVHLRLPGLAIDLPEEKSIAPQKGEGLPSLAGKAGIIVEAALELAQASEYVEQAEVAALAGSTQAWTSRVFAALTKAEAMEVIGTGPNKRWRPRPPRLLELWERDRGPEPTVTGLYVSVRSTEQVIRRLAKASSSREHYAVGGVTAADLYEPTLTSQPTPTIWVAAATPPIRLADDLGGGEVVESGPNVIVWQAPGDPALRLSKQLSEWRQAAGEGMEALFLVSPARAVVESAQGAGRAREVSDNLRYAVLARFGWLDG